MVWTGTVVESHEEAAAADALVTLLNLKNLPRILGCTETLPTPGAPEGTSGGRVDLIFAIDQADAQVAAARRLGFSDLKWACDVDADIYDAEVRLLMNAAA